MTKITSFFILGLLTLNLLFGQQLFVTPNGSGAKTGLSWADALDNQGLIDSLRIADYGTSFWLAEGDYYPHLNGERDSSFRLNNGVKVYGGFVGNESTLAQRDWVAHHSNINGNIGDPSLNTDNSLHLMKITTDTDSTTRLDGLRFINSFSVVTTFPNNTGSALFCNLFNETTEMNLVHCTFSYNQSVLSVIYFGGNGTSIFAPKIKDCTIADNILKTTSTAAQYLGTLTISPIAKTATLSAILEDCLFQHNQIDTTGGTLAGSLLLYHGGSGTTGFVKGHSYIKSCKFLDNTGGFGAGMCLDGDTTTVTNCLFTGNKVKFWGGAVCISSSRTSTKTYFDNCEFRNNMAAVNYPDGSGSAFGNFTHKLTETILTNCLFSGNKGGAAVANEPVTVPSVCRLDLVNCTIAGNQTGTMGAVYCEAVAGNTGTITIENSIIQGNTHSISQSGAGYITITAQNSCIEGGYAGSNVIDTNPGFLQPVSYTNAPTLLGDYHFTNPDLANVGNNAVNMSLVDLDGNARIVSNTIDFGCYESNIVTNQIEANILDWKCYPNPVQNTLHISLKQLRDNLQVSLRDVAGKQVLSESLALRYHHEIKLGDLPAGTYFLSVMEGENNLFQTQIVKQ